MIELFKNWKPFRQIILLESSVRLKTQHTRQTNDFIAKSSSKISDSIFVLM
jgi:hypothetical protein